MGTEKQNDWAFNFAKWIGTAQIDDTGVTLKNCDGVVIAVCRYREDAAEIARRCRAHDQLAETLKGIATASPSTWDEDVRDQFREWAQSRARAALAAAGVTP